MLDIPKPLLVYLGMIETAPSESLFLLAPLRPSELDPGMRIASITPGFQNRFEGKQEWLKLPTKLAYHELSRAGSSNAIIHELGDEETVETTLAELFFLLKKQSRGEASFLKLERENIFFISDVNNELCIVTAQFDGTGWDLDAEPLGGSRWYKGCGVFTRHYPTRRFTKIR